jgi:hypothetical protein
MHSSLIATLSFAALSLASLSLVTPSFAAKPGSIAYLSARQLQQFCKAQGGSYGTAKPAYFCVLQSGAITCEPRTRQCTLAPAATAAATSDSAQQDDSPPASLATVFLGPDSPPPTTGGTRLGGHGRHIPD